MKRWLSTFGLILFAGLTARAEVSYKRIEYKTDSGDACIGLMYTDNAVTGRRPGVLLADESGSNRPETKVHAAEIARLGYVVFTVDLYGEKSGSRDATRAIDPKSAAELAGINQPDHKLIRQRGEAALRTLQRQSAVDMKQIAAVGYGIGGTAMIELARTGVDLEGVVCLHGPVSTPLLGDKEKIQPTFLILEGADDPSAPEAQLRAFESEMKAAKVECKVARFPGVGHAFDEASEKKSTDAIRLYLADEIPLRQAGKPIAKAVAAMPKGVPTKVSTVLAYVDEHGEAMADYEGGRTFGNYEHRLPATDKSGRRVKYREWDVNPHRPGVNRGVERLITGSDDTAWYTEDHYETFAKLR